MNGPAASEPSDGMDRDGNVFIEPNDVRLMYWQERQIANCIFDNTVNHVVESYLTFFEEEEGNGARNDRRRVDVLPDLPDPIPNRIVSNERIEESAVLWAIDEHGLHHIDVSPPSISSPSSTSSTESDMQILYAPSERRLSGDSDDLDETMQIVKPINVSVDSDELENRANESEHIDFMEAAVAVAIQKKGLSIQTSPNR